MIRYPVLPLFTVVLLSLAAIGCGDDDESSPAGPGGGTDTTTTLLETPANLCNGAPPEVLAACGQVNYSVAVTGPMWDIANAPSFHPLPPKYDERLFAADTTYTLNDGQLTVTVTTTADDTSQYFEVIYDGTGFGETYDEFTYASGSRLDDRSRGEILIFNQALGTWQVTFSWAFGVLGQYFTSAHELNTGTDTLLTFLIVMNEDYSGSYIEYHNNEERELQVDWNSSGNGSWTEYATDGTSVLDSGTW